MTVLSITHPRYGRGQATAVVSHGIKKIHTTFAQGTEMVSTMSTTPAALTPASHQSSSICASSHCPLLLQMEEFDAETDQLKCQHSTAGRDDSQQADQRLSETEAPHRLRSVSAVCIAIVSTPSPSQERHRLAGAVGVRDRRPRSRQAAALPLPRTRGPLLFRRLLWLLSLTLSIVCCRASTRPRT